MFTRMPCKPTSNIKPITIEKPTLQSSKKQIMNISYNRKRIIKGAKLDLQNFVGLARTILKKYYQTTIIWYTKLALTRRKCFIGWECVNSHPSNHQLTYKSSHRKTNPIPKWVWIMTICMQERGSMIMNSQFWCREQKYGITQITRNSGTVWLFNGGNEEHTRNHTRLFPRNFPSNRRSRRRNGYVSTYGTWCGNKLRATGEQPDQSPQFQIQFTS